MRQLVSNGCRLVVGILLCLAPFAHALADDDGDSDSSSTSTASSSKADDSCIDCNSGISGASADKATFECTAQFFPDGSRSSPWVGWGGIASQDRDVCETKSGAAWHRAMTAQ